MVAAGAVLRPSGSSTIASRNRAELAQLLGDQKPMFVITDDSGGAKCSPATRSTGLLQHAALGDERQQLFRA